MPPKITGSSTAPLNTSSTPSSSSDESRSTPQSNTRAPVGGPLGALQSRGGQSTPLGRRENVTTEAGKYAEQSNATYYSAAVQAVSTVLGNNGLGITEQSQASVLDNLEGISKGKQTHTSAHMAESLSFGKDALEHARRGELRDGAVTAFGSALNAAASMTVGPARDLQTALDNPDPQVRTRAMASLHSDFETLPSPQHSPKHD
ncbi:hypothetical protein KY49_2083 [Burkholderia sp. MSHR3999]|uniref:hypothetical protein n=1 Tax=Burkholderia sp. MSHR3999 TaxID=1542965 RepID=UPI0005B6DD51|nr:hypothetical protein [Burkholderia sp. MSHR3999]KIP14999.1 hypothetical protein KY49_2083 [Burkholderia sp. MSHR3999]